MRLAVHQDLRSRFGAVRDQGARPTCLAFAASDIHAALRSPWLPLSCEFVFYHAQRRAGRSLSSGASLGSMLMALREDGQPVEMDWPYRVSLPATPDNFDPPSDLTVYRRGGESRVGAIDDIITALDGGEPTLILMMLSDAFYMPDGEGVIDTVAGETPDPLRRHAVIAVGHGSIGSERAILVRNSWGVEWGVVGHAWLPEWPAAGLVDTEIGCFHLSEVHNAKKEVQPRVQA